MYKYTCIVHHVLVKNNDRLIENTFTIMYMHCFNKITSLSAMLKKCEQGFSYFMHNFVLKLRFYVIFSLNHFFFKYLSDEYISVIETAQHHQCVFVS